jgi:hypothetical protein
MKRLKAAWLMWRLAGILDEEQRCMRASWFSVIVESGPALEERRRIAVANGEELPDPRTCCEVNVWKDAGSGATARAHRAATLVEALAMALDGQ